MTLLKNIFSYTNKPNKRVDSKLAQVWWWKHIAHCGTIVLQPEETIDSDKLKIEFANEEGEHWSYELQADGNLWIAHKVDYTKLMDENQRPFRGKLKDVKVYWKNYQQQFQAVSGFMISADENLWEFET